MASGTRTMEDNMSLNVISSVYAICSDAAGLQETSLLSCCSCRLCIILVATVDSIGAVFQTLYISIFIAYAEKPMKLKMFGFLVSVFAVFASIVFISLELFDSPARQLFVGYLSVASLISMFAFPLLIIVSSLNAFAFFRYSDEIDSLIRFLFQNLVIKMRSVEYMPFSLSLCLNLCCENSLPLMHVRNGIGTVPGIAQLALYAYFERTKVLLAVRSHRLEKFLTGDINPPPATVVLENASTTEN
ncbi:bidirectional sugar transporter SWEET2a-like [Hibiscus syriacus]|uniref:bidirectional sugar transporter SWEET2a-like n=1 Tax=Hibiscus syriacus TaxID=106335 RepID=UPI00192186E3|nr:bidirectional sugar transporter SWEET2a-like [Hibiscus syriacus]